ncbi:hypothetical protein LTR85_007421 [Meristemomyces frigidus]|nr:hypothetical protein LTR85_007421 [Meristemomyces frigidus]
MTGITDKDRGDHNIMVRSFGVQIARVERERIMFNRQREIADFQQRLHQLAQPQVAHPTQTTGTSQTTPPTQVSRTALAPPSLAQPASASPPKPQDLVDLTQDEPTVVPSSRSSSDKLVTDSRASTDRLQQPATTQHSIDAERVRSPPASIGHIAGNGQSHQPMTSEQILNILNNLQLPPQFTALLPAISGPLSFPSSYGERSLAAHSGNDHPQLQQTPIQHAAHPSRKRARSSSSSGEHNPAPQDSSNHQHRQVPPQQMFDVNARAFPSPTLQTLSNQPVQGAAVEQRVTAAKQTYRIIAHTHPTVVILPRTRNRVVVELRCPICGTNTDCSGNLLRGVPAFAAHLHACIRGTSTLPAPRRRQCRFSRTVRQCTVHTLSEEEIRGIREGVPHAYDIRPTGGSGNRLTQMRRRRYSDVELSDNEAEDEAVPNPYGRSADDGSAWQVTGGDGQLIDPALTAADFGHLEGARGTVAFGGALASRA